MYIKFQLKKYRGVMSHDTLKIKVKFEEKPICCFTNDKLVNCDPSTQKSQKFAL